MKIKRTIKAGCIILKREDNTIGIIYRQNRNDYEFAKGHLEKNENIMECALRETAEETKRNVKIINKINRITSKYRTPSGEHCICYYYVAEDMGKSDNTSTDTHDLVWCNISDVSKILTYKTGKTIWKKVFPKIKKLMEEQYD